MSKKMSKERIDRYKCDVCTNKKETPTGVLGISKKPAGWGKDLYGKDTFCSECKTDYEREYKAWYSSWLKTRKTKGKV